jgi:WD40 repeat protein
VFGQGAKGIMRVSANGGKPEQIVTVKQGELASGPQMLAGGEEVLFSLATGDGSLEQWDNGKVVVQSLKTGERKTLVERGSVGRYVSTGHIIYAFGGTLFAVPFDLRQLQVTGGQVPIVEGVRRANATGAAHFSYSNTGSLIYVTGPASAVAGDQQVLALMDRKGTLETLRVPPQSYHFLRASPDGKRIAFTSEKGKEANVWIYDLAGSTAPRQLTVGASNRYSVWSADGERVAFQSDREGDLGIFWQRADGVGTAERLTKPEQGVIHIPDSWAPDGKYLSFTAIKGTEGSVWILSIKDKKSTAFAQTPSRMIRNSAFSPDGHWLAYNGSSGSSMPQVWVEPFPNTTGAKYPILEYGQPFWSPDGKELFYNSGPGQLSAVSITTKPGFAFGPASRLPQGLPNASPLTSPRLVDVTRDGKFVLAVAADQTPSGTPAAPQIQVVLNWFEDVKQKMSSK